MSIKISFKKSAPVKTSTNLVLFVDEKFSTKSLKKYISNSEFIYVSDLLKTSDLKKNLQVFEMSSKKKVVLILIIMKLLFITKILKIKWKNSL